MKLQGSEPLRRGFWTVLRILLLSAAMCCSAQAQPENCSDLYGAIRKAAMHCGFFCDQNRLRPLQASYEARCIISVVAASDVGFDSSPEPSTSLAVYSETNLPDAESLRPALLNGQWLLGTVQAIDTQQAASRSQRMSSAEAFLAYCKSALTRVPYNGPRVGLTEESGDRSDAQLEFSSWRLNTIFSECTEAAHGILDAQDVRQEAAAWFKLTQLLEQDKAVRELSMYAQLLQSRRDKVEKDIFGTGNWRTMRAIIFSAASTLLENH